jgi:tRNA-uridine 2-sulfurtransferase
MTQQVFVAMSGGVDSAVTALLLKEAGYRVSAIHLELTPLCADKFQYEHTSLEETCRSLEIPLVYWHLEESFESAIIDYFSREYRLGRTPNPCIRCNRLIKFGLLLDHILELGGDYLATGHYARVEPSINGFRLLKGLDGTKDQSYFLYSLTQKVLSRVLCPLGVWHKSNVKALADLKGLPVSGRKESQDICFVPNNDHKAFLAARLNLPPGDIVDRAGKVLGRHQGLAYYTVGQRQGMGLSAAERLYVVDLQAESNRLVIGYWDDLLQSDLVAGNLSWVGGRPPQSCLSVMARVRYRSREAAAQVELQGDRARVHFELPQRAIAPGQSVVFYQGDEVIGGGIIEKPG